MLTYDSLKKLVDSLLMDEIEMLKSLIPLAELPNSINNIINRERTIVCPLCGSINIKKNGKKNGRQRYICKDCHKSFSINSNTIVFKTRKLYSNWIRFIHSELLGLTLKQESHECNISQTTAFSWRHKLYSSLSEAREKVKLSGEIQIDSTFLPINLKGTRSNMPRFSKKRTSSTYRGISHHKVCILTAIDEYDNIAIEIAGTGREGAKAVNYFSKYIENCTVLISDGNHATITLADEMNVKSQIVKSKTYKNEDGYSLAEINKIHNEIAKDLNKRNGVSLKHLQGYLDMFWFKKLLNYKIQYEDRDNTLFNKAVTAYKTMFIKDIFKKAFPFDLNDVYADFHK